MNEVVTLVNTNRGNGKKKNLERMYLLMKKLGDPQKKIKFVHVAGTNGKGTTSAFIASILKEAGLKTGLYISPHLEVINERISINDEPITDEDFITATQKVKPFVFEVEQELDETLYSFEILTAVSIVYFADQKCDLVVLETGIGGRLDSTNVIETPEVAVITAIGIDHINILGNSIEEIAAEKAGIIKEKGSVVLNPMQENLLSIFAEKVKSVDGTLKSIDPDAIELVETTINGQTFHYSDFPNLSVKMVGTHQLINACLAIEASKILRTKKITITDEAIRVGLEKTFWPGRMEKVSDEPIVFIDGAHNEQGVEVLRKNLDILFPDSRITFVAGIMKDKDYMQMFEVMKDKANQFLLISPDPWRGFDPSEVADKLIEKGIKAQPKQSISDIIHYIRSESSKEEVIVVFGSLYLVGDVKKYL